MNDVHGNIFCLYCTKTNVECAHQTFCCTVRMNRGWPCLLAHTAPAIWNPPKVTSHAAHLYSCHAYICMTSAQPYHQAVPSSRHTVNAPKYKNGVCNGELWPPPHLSKSGQHWPLSGSLSQYALRYETAKHMWLFCMIACLFVCVPRGSAAMWDLLTLQAHLHCQIDGDWKLFIIMGDDW